MSHKKLRKFAELTTFSNAIQKESDYKGRWSRDYFQNDHEITLELGCGKGEYTLALARRFPNRNFIGIDIKGERIWRGAKIALQENLTNVVFLRIYIDHILDHFAENEISEIWITFPDPYRRNHDRNKRLTGPAFLDRYEKILKKDGHIHFKTDAQQLFEFTRKVIEQRRVPVFRTIEDLHNPPVDNDDLLNIKTSYESRYLEEGRKIYYIEFGLQEKMIQKIE